MAGNLPAGPADLDEPLGDPFATGPCPTCGGRTLFDLCVNAACGTQPFEATCYDCRKQFMTTDASTTAICPSCEASERHAAVPSDTTRRTGSYTVNRIYRDGIARRILKGEI